MMMLKTQARPYAKAVFELASEADSCPVWHQILSSLSAFVQHPEVWPLLKARTILPVEWVDWIHAVAPTLLSRQEVRHFLHILAEKRQLFLLPTILSLFEELWRKAKNEKHFTVVSPALWTETGSAQFIDFLSKRFACQAEVQFETNPDMIAGVEVVGEGWRLDYSLRGWLTQLRDRLAHRN